MDRSAALYRRRENLEHLLVLEKMVGFPPRLSCLIVNEDESRSTHHHSLASTTPNTIARQGFKKNTSLPV
jgi:hypothetical protein